MQINITARHGHLSPPTQEKIKEKSDKLRRFFDRLTAIQVTVDLEHQDAALVELQVSAEHREDFVASDQSASVLAALDGALHKMEKQLRKHKEKLTEKLTGHRSSGLKHLEVPGEREPGTEE